MVKIANADLAHVIAKFAGTFETLWGNREFERYDPSKLLECRDRTAMRVNARTPGLDPISWTPALRRNSLLSELAFEVNRAQVAIV